MAELASILGVPTVPTVAITGEGLKELVSSIGDASSATIEAIMGRVS